MYARLILLHHFFSWLTQILLFVDPEYHELGYLNIISQADYSGQLEKSGEQESFVQAAMMGDVLADEQDHSRQSRTINQPRFSLWN